MKSIKACVLLLAILSIATFFFITNSHALKDAVKSIFKKYVPIYTQEDLYESNKKIKNYLSADFFVSLTAIQSKDEDLILLMDDALLNFQFNDLDFSLKTFSAPFLKYKGTFDTQGTSYLEVFQDDILVMQENGLLFALSKKAFLSSQTNIPVRKIETNFHEFIDYYEFYNASKFGIKDIKIVENALYVSSTVQVKPNCFSISLFRGIIQENSISFEKFFEPKSCVTRTEELEFNAHQSGGRIIDYNNKIAISLGDFRQRNLAQDLQSDYGKILVIDPSDLSSEILIMGTRNAQGLFYDKANEILISSEHGPYGGDELNIIELNDNSEIVNLGWPISSYGGHYNYSYYGNQGELIEKRERKIYKDFPLYKSHDNYGFIEPTDFFVPSVGISEVIIFDTEQDKKILILGTMGNDTNLTDDDLSLIMYAYDKGKISNKKVIRVNERVRDIVNLDNENLLIMLESTGKIGKISIN